MSRPSFRYQRASSRGGDAELCDALRYTVCKKLQAEFRNVDDGDLVQHCEGLLEQAEQQCEELRLRAVADEKAFLESKARVVAEGEQTLRTLGSVISETGDLLKTLQPHLMSDTDHLKDAEDVLDKVTNNDRQLEHLRWLRAFQEQCDQIRSSLACNSLNDAINFLQGLVNWCEELKESRCSHLLSYLFRLTIHWTRLVADKVAQDLPAVFTRIGYPRPPSVHKSLAVSVDERAKSEIVDVVKTLLKLRLPEYVRKTDAERDLSFLNGNVPLKYFIQPLEKRFRFHFFVSEKTNKVEKPEWYLTQLLSWIRDYSDFVGDVLQPIFRSEGLGIVNAKVEFVTGLAALGQAKFLSTVPLLLLDNAVFAHAVDEVLSFGRTLDKLGYETVRQEFCCVLVVPEVFDHWIKVEELLAEERLGVFRAAPSAWKGRYQEDSESLEDLKVPECAERYVAMLKGISERHELVPSAEHQLRFVELQLSYAGDFVELVKSVYEAEENDAYHLATQLAPSLATATKYFYQYLMDFGNTALMMQLLSPSLYSPPSTASRLSQRLSDRLPIVMEDAHRISSVSFLDRIAVDTATSVESYIRQYGRIGWKTYTSVAEYLGPSVTPVIGELIYALKTMLSMQKERLFSSLFNAYVGNLMRILDEFFFEEVIRKNAFSAGGADQLKFDVLGNLVMVLQRLTHLPNAGLAKTVDACGVLCMIKGSAMLLMESFDQMNKGLASQEDITALKRNLTNLNVKSLSLEEVSGLIRKRSDLEPL